MPELLNPPCVLNAAQVAAYEAEGYLILRRYFPAEVIAQASAEADALLLRHDLMDMKNIRCRWQKHVDTGECLFETFDPVVDIAPVCSRLATDPNLLAALGDLYGEEACLFKDKLILKPPGAYGYGLHQDFIAWKNFPRSFLTVVIPIDPTTAENGCTEVFPGLHRQGYLSDEDGNYHQLPLDVIADTPGVMLEMEPGDLAIFGCFVPHRSMPNRSPRWRRQLYVSYNALSDGGRQRDRHYDEFHRWLHDRYAEYGKTDVYFR
jgi:ectoine hydroxylase-related dioxygenase (phytanoyl-CoA dioxygenase family)